MSRSCTLTSLVISTPAALVRTVIPPTGLHVPLRQAGYSQPCVARVFNEAEVDLEEAITWEHHHFASAFHVWKYSETALFKSGSSPHGVDGA